MASHMQMVIYEGHLGADPEMRYTPNGKQVTNFSLASTRKYTTTTGTKVEETIWLRVSVFGKTAEIVNQYCEKGSHVIVTGYLRPDKDGSPKVYEKKNHEWGASYELTASDVRIIKGKERTSGNGDVPEEVGETSDSMPF